MPYNKDGTKKQNPTKLDWYIYHLKKGTYKGGENGKRSRKRRN